LYTIPPSVFWCTFQVTNLISLILFLCIGRFQSSWLFRGYILGFLTVDFFRGGGR
jgi:hypothetical protein